MLKEIRKLIQEYYNIPKGVFIEDYLGEIVFSNDVLEIRMTRRALKHIVEQRRVDNYKAHDIESIFVSLIEIIRTRNYSLMKDTKKLNSYSLIEKECSSSHITFIALELIFIEPNIYYIKTAFFRSI